MTYLKTSSLALSAGLLFVTACTSIDTPTGASNTRQQEGIGLGIATGLVAGLIGGKNAKERRNAALAGALIGGVAGGVIGSNLDKQAAELQAELGNGRIQIINKGDHLIVRMPDDILFAVDSAQLQNTLRADLGILANNIQRYPGSTIEVTGHTDSDASATYNLELSRQRANAVAAVLIANGVSGARVRTIGAGESQPLATNNTAAGKAMNRRVEIIIRPTA